MPHLRLLDALEKHYAAVKAAHPTEGRRKNVLRALLAGWPDATAPVSNATTEFPIENLAPDPFDEVLDAADTPGLLIRTDFSNEEAWQAFLAKFQAAERELLESLRPSPPGDASSSDPSPKNQDVEMGAEAPAPQGDDGADSGGSDAEDDDDGALEAVVMVYNPTSSAERELVNNISNLSALQLFCDADIRPAIPPPPDMNTRYKPNNVLINKNGWQLVFAGKDLWIYDAQSARDECVRVVTQAGEMYGTATGDSWRARVTHIPELQFNTSFLNMKVDFGGLDRWDAHERSRNLTQASTL